MTKAVTSEMLKRVAEKLMENSAPGFRVKTEEEANTMTASDSTGHKWTVGERYYRLESVDGRVFFRAKP